MFVIKILSNPLIQLPYQLVCIEYIIQQQICVYNQTYFLLVLAATVDNSYALIA